MLAKEVSKAANEVGMHLSTILKLGRLTKSSFYKWSMGSSCSKRSQKKLEILLSHLEKMKLLQKSLEEKLDVEAL